MKTKFKPILACAFFLFAFISPTHNITGRWIAVGSDGFTTYANFKKDGSFTHISTKGEMLNKGKYKTDKDTFYVSDSTCNINYWGKYLLNFYGEDSVSFSVIEDTCKGREEYINGGSLKRTKK